MTFRSILRSRPIMTTDRQWCSSSFSSCADISGIKSGLAIPAIAKWNVKKRRKRDKITKSRLRLTLGDCGFESFRCPYTVWTEIPAFYGRREKRFWFRCSFCSSIILVDNGDALVHDDGRRAVEGQIDLSVRVVVTWTTHIVNDGYSFFYLILNRRYSIGMS